MWEVIISFKIMIVCVREFASCMRKACTIRRLLRNSIKMDSCLQDVEGDSTIKMSEISFDALA